MRKLAGLIILMVCTMIVLSGCPEQKFPHGQQAKPDNIEEKK